MPTVTSVSPEARARLDALVADGLIDSYTVEPVYYWRILTGGGPIRHVAGTLGEVKIYVERYAPMKRGWTAQWIDKPDGHAAVYRRCNGAGRVLRGYDIAAVVINRAELRTDADVIDLSPEPEPMFEAVAAAVARLDGCTCDAIRGAHRTDCPWSMR